MKQNGKFWRLLNCASFIIPVDLSAPSILCALGSNAIYVFILGIKWKVFVVEL